MINQPGSRSSQRGAVLILSLVMLLALTFIGVASVSNSTLQERIVGGTRDQLVAFEAAEAALRVGEGMAVTYTGNLSDFYAYLELKPTDGFNCTITSTDWQAPAGLQRNPAAPDCRVTSYYAELVASEGPDFELPEICILSGAASGTSGASVCHSESFRSLVYEVEANGYGSTGAQATLRSIYQVFQ